MNFNDLIFETAFVCMISDGEIHEKELSEIQSIFKKEGEISEENIDSKISDLIKTFKQEGNIFILKYFRKLEEANLSNEESLSLLQIAYSIFNADQDLSYSEVKLFKAIKGCLTLTDDEIRERIENIDDMFLLEDIKQDPTTLIENFMKNSEYEALFKLDLTDLKKH